MPIYDWIRSKSTEPSALIIRVSSMALIKFPTSRARQFEALVRPLLPQLYRQAYRLCGHRQNAEDLVQELLTRLYARSTSLNELENLKTWLLRALYNLFIDSVRKQSHDKQVERGESAEEAIMSVPCPAGSAEEVTVRRLEQQQIESALLVLNADQRAVIVLHDMEGYTLIELEPILDVPLGTLKSRLHRARLQLREILSREPFGSEQRVRS